MTISDASFAVTVQPGELHFNAAHFITLGGQCEPLHGHNFHVRVDVRGESDADAVVIDFVLLTRLAREACAALNDRVLLPGHSGRITSYNVCYTKLLRTSSRSRRACAMVWSRPGSRPRGSR